MAVKGSLRDVSFVELLQLMHLSRKTGRIEITADKRWAMVVFREGVVWHVEPRGFQGATPDEVVYNLISMLDGNFTLQRVQVLPTLERSVHQSTESLILEGTKRLDDASVAAAEMGSDSQLAYILKFKPGAEAKVRYVPQNVKKVIQAIDGQRSLSEVIKLSQLDANQAAQIIKELVNHNILEAVEPPKDGEPQAPAEPATTA
jgi:hypothetical protein